MTEKKNVIDIVVDVFIWAMAFFVGLCLGTLFQVVTSSGFQYITAGTRYHFLTLSCLGILRVRTIRFIM